MTTYLSRRCNACLMKGVAMLYVISIAGSAVAQSRDPMRPPLDQLPELAAQENSLARAIRDAQLSGSDEKADLVQVIKVSRSSVTAVLAGGQPADVIDRSGYATGRFESQEILVRTEAGERRLSPTPQAEKIGRPVGSPPSTSSFAGENPRPRRSIP